MRVDASQLTPRTARSASRLPTAPRTSVSASSVATARPTSATPPIRRATRCTPVLVAQSAWAWAETWVPSASTPAPPPWTATTAWLARRSPAFPAARRASARSSARTTASARATRRCVSVDSRIRRTAPASRVVTPLHRIVPTRGTIVRCRRARRRTTAVATASAARSTRCVRRTETATERRRAKSSRTTPAAFVSNGCQSDSDCTDASSSELPHPARWRDLHGGQRLQQR